MAFVKSADDQRNKKYYVPTYEGRVIYFIEVPYQ